MPIFRDRPDLLQRFRAGDRQALTEVYEAYVEKVGAMLKWGCHLHSQAGTSRVYVSAQDLLDVAQEVFVRAFSARGRAGYDGIRDYEPYLLMIARNTMIDWLRSRRALPAPAMAELAAALATHPPVDGPAPWEDPGTMQVLRRYVDSLPAELRALHRHRYVDGLSQEAAASAMGLTRQRLRTLEQHLREGLARALAQGASAPGLQAS